MYGPTSRNVRSNDKIVTAESMGFPLAAGLSLRVHKPYVFIRKRQYGLPGEENRCFSTW